jgi:hypothetical protein
METELGQRIEWYREEYLETPAGQKHLARMNDYRISTWPCVRKDVRGWFEGAGWKEPEDWPPTARLLFEAVDGLISGEKAAWHMFLNSDYCHGFGTGFVSPILFCLDEQHPAECRPVFGARPTRQEAD